MYITCLESALEQASAKVARWCFTPAAPISPLPPVLPTFQAAELELLSRPEPWLQAVRTAEHIASKLGIFYHRHPYHDLDGAVTQLEGVLHTCEQLLQETERTTCVNELHTC